MTSALKMGSRRLDLGRMTPAVFTYGGGWVPETKLESVCAATRDPPMTPREFCLELAKKRFTNGSDGSVVEKLYSSFFDSAAPAATKLNFSDVSWGGGTAEVPSFPSTDESAAEEAAAVPVSKIRKLAAVLPRFTALTALDLSKNTLGSEGIRLWSNPSHS